MSEPPTVSVVLPTYNAADYLQQSLASLRDQTFSDFEVVVVDDGSTDDTLEILSAHDGLNLRILERDVADGLPAALNEGVRAARGEFVARQDADDWSHPDRLDRQVSYLSDHEDVALLGTSAELVDAVGERVDTRIVPLSPTFDSLLAKNHFVHGSVMARRDALLDAGLYDEAFEFSEDYDLWLRLAKEHPVRNLQEPLYSLRIHRESIYGSELRKVKLYSSYARKRALGETPLTSEELRSQGVDSFYESLSPVDCARFHAEMAQALLRYGNLERARTHCRRGLTYRLTYPMLWVFLLLSFTTPGTVGQVERAYRKVLNARVS